MYNITKLSSHSIISNQPQQPQSQTQRHNQQHKSDNLNETNVSKVLEPFSFENEVNLQLDF